MTIGLRTCKQNAESRAALYPPNGDERPHRRADCPVERPCPFVGCKYHLYLDVTEGGGIKYNKPHCNVWHLADSCALDLADEGGHTLEEISERLNVTRERIRQIEARALSKLIRNGAADKLLGAWVE